MIVSEKAKEKFSEKNSEEFKEINDGRIARGAGGRAAGGKGDKHTLLRSWFQAAWFVLTNSYLRGYTKGMIFTGGTKAVCVPGLNCYSCPGALGACPMGALQAVMGDSSYRFSLYVFGMLATFGAVFGRLICGWMCPFGFFQDLLNKIPFKIKRKNLPGHRYLKYLKYVILIVFPILLVSLVTDAAGTSSPWFCEWICPSGTLLGGIPLVSVNSSLRAAAGGRFIWKLVILIAVTLLSIIYYRPFCKYLCPLGAIYSLFNPVSSYRLIIDKDKCVSCGTCQKACGMDIKTFETPNSPECIRCGSCMKACPTGAISSTWGRTGQKLRSRCFVDAELPAAPALAASPVSVPSASLSRMATFYGIITVITGLVTLIGTFYTGLLSSMLSYMTIDAYREMNIMYIVTSFIWMTGSILLVITGIFAVRSRRDTEAITSIKEKARFALILETAGILTGLAGIILDPGTMGIYAQMVLLAPSFFPGIPLAVMLASSLKKYALCEQSSRAVPALRKIIWIVLSAAYVINFAALPAVLSLLQ